MPALDFALGHRMIGRAAKVFDIAVVEPFGQVARNVAGTIVGQPPWSTGWLGLIQAAGPQCQVEGVGSRRARLTGKNQPQPITFRWVTSVCHS